MFNMFAKNSFKKTIWLQLSGKTDKAEKQYKRVIERFPNSKYAIWARAELDKLKNEMAAKVVSYGQSMSGSDGQSTQADIADSRVITPSDAQPTQSDITGDDADRIFAAAQQGNLEAVLNYLDEGIDVHIKNNDGESLLHAAARSGYVPLLKLLIGRGLDVDIQGTSNITPLMLAAGEGRRNINAIGFLLDNGANIDARDADGKTAIMLAAARGKIRCANE